MQTIRQLRWGAEASRRISSASSFACELIPASTLSLSDAAALAAPVQRTLLLPDGGHFVGEFSADFKPHGEGIEFAADGTERASGQWRDGFQHGHGWQLKADGNRYEGGFAWGHFVGILKDYADLTFADACVGGVGKLTQTDGSVYEGDFFMCDRLGLGVQWDKNGNMISCGCLDWNQHHSRPVPRIKIPVGTFLSAAGEPRRRAARAQ